MVKALRFRLHWNHNKQTECLPHADTTNLAVGRTGEVPAVTGLHRSGGPEPANKPTLGIAPKSSGKATDKLNSLALTKAQGSMPPPGAGLWAFSLTGWRMRARQPRTSFAGATCTTQAVPVHHQNRHHGVRGASMGAVSAVCIIIASNRSISCCWASTRACRASTRAVWSWLLTSENFSDVSPSTSTIHCPRCLCAAYAPALIRLRTVSAEISKCAAASRIDKSIEQSIGQVPMQVVQVAYAGFGQKVAA